MKLKRLMTLSLALVLLLSCMGITAFAESTEPWADDETPANNQIFYIAKQQIAPWNNEGNLRANYDAENSTFDSNSGKGIMAFKSDLTSIPEGGLRGSDVNRINEEGEETTTKIILPASVTSIDDGAFSGRVALESISMPGVTSIGARVFNNGCEKLTDVYMPEVTTIGDYAFGNCTALSKVYIPKATSILNTSFGYCSNLKYVYAPESIETVYVEDSITDDINGYEETSFYLYPVTISAENGTIAVDGEVFEEVDGCVLYLKGGEEYNITATPGVGYALDSLTYITEEGSTANITDGEFVMPSKATTLTANVTDNTTGEDIDLDLEESTADIPVSTTIDQYYTKTETTSETVYNRISIKWDTPVVTVRVSEAQKWDPTTLTWVTDTDKNGTATVVEGTNVTAFTLKNYSINAFTCTMDFTPTDKTYFEDTAATFDENNGTIIAAIETGDDGNALAKYYTDDDTMQAVDESEVPTLTITGTLNINTSAFKNATATTENVQYGNYTITCTKAAN